MKKIELQHKLREIHLLLTRAMMTEDAESVEIIALVDRAEGKLNDLENEIEMEPESNPQN